MTSAPVPSRGRQRQPSPAGPAQQGADGAAIRLSGVHKSYGTVQAVRGIDLTVAPGEVVAFLGPNGAGKSTAIDMMLGLSAPDSGTAQLFGGHPHDSVAAGRVGAMLQSGALLPDVKVSELIRTFAALHRHPMRIDEALDRAGIADIAGSKTQNLSGGQAQRVRFALALVPNPDLVLLDEPTVGMDVEVRRQFWASMREFAASGKTVLFATHYLQEADDYADRIVVLARGVVIADGTGAAIKGQVSGRTLSAVIPDCGEDQLRTLPTVTGVEAVGGRWSVHCTDSDGVLRTLLSRYPQMHDIEIQQANLEQAFLKLTGDDAAVAAQPANSRKGA